MATSRRCTTLVVLVAALVGISDAGNIPGGGHGGGFGHRGFNGGPGRFGAGGFGGGHGRFGGGPGRFGGGHGGDYGGGYGGGYGQDYGPPMPYQFGYSSQDPDGTHAHSQTSDGRRVQGHYVIQLADGRQRRVDYTADETGFHAKVMTNELGTESKDAADAIYESSAIPGDQAAIQGGPGPRGPYGGGPGPRGPYGGGPGPRGPYGGGPHHGFRGGSFGGPHGGRGFGPGGRW
ncbi:glycine-rich cell wall structural protein 1.8-like [Galendromus occidentalis]|uniref:Glycine-rich cell wall structural protein 1.8-like n=1 Tax=Galendromus occidentalis TaxID=34638 RepID=A0AAJ6QNY4_9ACAR|nr:glycine-rich cell wall structural protein 1.8-like [Galendromus occidentalis]